MNLRRLTARGPHRIISGDAAGASDRRLRRRRTSSQNSLTAARSLEEINNQILQLQNEAMMLTNEAKNLTTLPFNIVGQLQATLLLTTQLISQAQGIAFQLAQAQAQFARFYPAPMGRALPAPAWRPMPCSAGRIHCRRCRRPSACRRRPRRTSPAIRTRLPPWSSRARARSASCKRRRRPISSSRLQSRQSIQEQQLRLTQDRGAALELARASPRKRAHAKCGCRFLGNGTQYTPQPINTF